MSFQHLLLTNFNSTLYENKKIYDHYKWMNFRIDLFRRFTIPSVAAQICKNFIWYVEVNKQTPEPQRQAIDSLIKPLNGKIVEKFSDVELAATDKYIYSVIDCDDAMPKQYMQQVQESHNILPAPMFIEMTLMFSVLYDMSHYQIIYQHFRRQRQPDLACEIFSVVTTSSKIPNIKHGFTYSVYPRHHIIHNAGVQIVHKTNSTRVINDIAANSQTLHDFPTFLMQQYGWDKRDVTRHLINDAYY